MRKKTCLVTDNQRRLDTGLSDSELVKPLISIYDRVVALAEKYPVVKGNYNLLWAYYCKEYHGHKFPVGVKELLRIPSHESVGRAFRKAVEKHDIQPTEKMLKRRKQREEAIREFIHDLGEPDIRAETIGSEIVKDF